MKRYLSIFFSFVILLTLLGGCTPQPETTAAPTTMTDFVEDGAYLTLTRGDVTVTLDPATGLVKQVCPVHTHVHQHCIHVDLVIGGGDLLHKTCSRI